MKTLTTFLLSVSLFCFFSCSQKEEYSETENDSQLRMAGLNTIVPLYRYYAWDETKRGDHMFIKDAPPSMVWGTNKVVNGISYMYEGQSFSVFKDKDFIADTPLYMYYDAANMNHYFGTNPSQTGPNKELLGYISSKPQVGLEPMLEFYYDKDKDSHYYLESFGENRANLEEIGYVYKRIVGYAPPGTSFHNNLAYLTMNNGITKYYHNFVRIGEYYWMTSNIDGPADMKGQDKIITQTQINNNFWVLYIDPLKYTVTPEMFHRYSGKYYSAYGRNYIHENGKVYERSGKHDSKLVSGWGMPRSADVRQLFAMCGTGSEVDVRQTLCFKQGETPIAEKEANVFFMSGNNNNKYGFNLVYGGFRYHGDGTMVYKPYPNGDPKARSINLSMYGLGSFCNAHYMPTYKQRTALIEDYPSTEKEPESFFLLPMRWCRKLTDQELGYKLYINSAMTDIQKLDWRATPPSGYTELKNGYLRGFYVQYVINRTSGMPVYSVSQLRDMALKLADVTHHQAPIIG